MKNLPFSTFKDVNSRAKGRQLVLFGGSDIASKTVRKLSQPLAFIADNNPNLWGSEELGVPVYSPQKLREKGPDAYFIVITTTSFSAVAEQLIGMGFTPERDFVVSPILNDLRTIAQLENKTARLLFSSGAPPSDSPRSGGGVYEICLNGTEMTYRKVYSGNCHGIFTLPSSILIVDDHTGLVELSKSYEVVKTGKVTTASRPHGIAFSEVTGNFYVIGSYLDAVMVFNRNFEQIGVIPISDKIEREGTPCHHCNDLCVVGSSLYVSLFSITGNWRRDVYDGGVLEFNIHTGKVVGPVITDLWMPHSVQYHEGSIVVLDSLRGELKKNNAQVCGKFPGFARGLDFDGTHFYIGQSRNRNFSKFLGLSLNTAIDTGIIVFDEETKVSRTLPLPQTIAEIHAVSYQGEL